MIRDFARTCASFFIVLLIDKYQNGSRVRLAVHTRL